MKFDKVFVAQLDDLLSEAQRLRQQSQYTDLSGNTDADLVRFVTRARSAIYRIAGRTSAYGQQCDAILLENAPPSYHAGLLIGVLDSLRADLDAGYLQSLSELVRGELFGDFLEMADHLLEQGYKDPAAVLAGTALEAHIHHLCDDVGIDLSDPTSGRPRKADVLNADLAKAEVYSKLDQKNVTSWLGLRNEAAHGQTNAYSSDQVKLLIASVRDFVSRHP